MRFYLLHGCDDEAVKEHDTFELGTRLLRGAMGAEMPKLVSVGNADGSGVYLDEFEVDDEAFEAFVRSYAHNARGAGRKACSIECMSAEHKDMTWDEFVSASAGMTQQQIIDEFRLMLIVPTGDGKNDPKPLDRRTFSKRLAQAKALAKDWEDGSSNFLIYLNRPVWKVRGTD